MPENGPDSAPEYAIEALDTALKARTAGTTAGPAAGGANTRGLGAADTAIVKIPSLTFKFRAPNFLSNRSRWVLFLSLDLIAVAALLIAWDMVKTTADSDGAEWFLPPVLTIIVAGLTLAMAFATVMGYGNVDLSSTVGEGESPAAGGFEVTATVPTDKRQDAPRNTHLEATFSEEVDPATLTAETFKVRTAAGVAVTGAVSTDDDKVTGRFVPAAELSAGTAYEAEITTGVKSAAGMALAAAKTWTFTTQAGRGGGT